MSNLEHELRLAHELADAADEISLRYFRSDQLAVETKPDLTPVTQADREVELAIRRRLGNVRPRHAIVGEEFGSGPGTTGARWIIDPIDGTKRFMRGVPVWATLLALELDGELAVGVASAPALGRRWWAARGAGAYAAGRKIHVSGIQRLADAHVAHASLDGWLARGDLSVLETLTRACWSITGYGDFWSHVLVAEGVLDAALEPSGLLWDFAPLKLIVEEAGGQFTDFGGQSTAAGPTGISSNGSGIHEEVLALLRA